ncbi:MAG: tRNA(Ile)-lysidine synthetase, partial [Mesorhizobium sp.]|nr:tRNA(Ile)-lysidine synthetase [Mesorhizobium sp.]
RLAPAFAAQEREAAVYALRILLAVSGGRDQLPEADSVAELLEKAARPPFRATLSGAVLDARASGIFLRREARGLPGRVPAETGSVWGGRFFVAPTGGGSDIAPLGKEGSIRMAGEVEGVPGALVRAALFAEPGLWRDGELIGLAGALPRMAPWAGLLPCFDLAPARAVAALLGAESPPALPYVDQTAASA